MKKRMRKILLVNLILCLCLFHIASVRSYEYQDAKNKTPVELKRKEIYQLREMYRYLLGEDISQYNLNYGGICSIVTVRGSGTYTLEDYIAGVVKQEVGSESDKPELLKAQAIAARSFLIASKQSSADCTVDNGQSYQAFSEVKEDNPSDKPYIDAARDTAGMVVMRNGKVALTQYLSYPNSIYCYETNGHWHINFQRFSDDPNSAWTWEGPSKSEVLAANNWAPTTGAPSLDHHWGMSQIVAGWMAANGKTYKEILDTFYGGTIEALSDGDYIGPIEFVDSEFGQVRYWNQGDYGNYYYSSNVGVGQYKRSKGGYATIASHGCGPSSMAIVLSSFTGRDISPIVTTQQVCQLGGCTSSGSYYWALQSLAEQYGYKAEFVKKNGNLSKVTSALASGNSLVVALMGPGIFTTGGHYIVLTGTRADGYVSVADPASRKRTQQKWFSFNKVVEEVQSSGFLIVTK